MIYDPDQVGYQRTRAELEEALKRLEFRRRGLRSQLQDVIRRLSLVERECLRISNNIRAMKLTEESEAGETQ